MRTVAHPGAPLQPRRLVAWAAGAGELRVTLAEGADLLEGLTAALAGRGITDAAVQLTGGGFARMQYLTGIPDASGRRVATYSAPTTLAGPVTLIGGSAILGRDKAGAPLLHCHLVVVDRAGRVHGGHAPAGACTVGPEGLTARAAVLAGAGFRVADDPETDFTIFHPAEA